MNRNLRAFDEEMRIDFSRIRSGTPESNTEYIQNRIGMKLGMNAGPDRYNILYSARFESFQSERIFDVFTSDVWQNIKGGITLPDHTVEIKWQLEFSDGTFTIIDVYTDVREDDLEMFYELSHWEMLDTIIENYKSGIRKKKLSELMSEAKSLLNYIKKVDSNTALFEELKLKLDVVKQVFGELGLRPLILINHL